MNAEKLTTIFSKLILFTDREIQNVYHCMTASVYSFFPVTLLSYNETNMNTSVNKVENAK